MNWRKPVILSLLKLTGSEIPDNLEFIKSIEYKSKEEIKAIQVDKLEKLLLHAHKNVPYYNKILKASGVVIDSKVNLENFSKIPILTKDIIRENFEDLKSKDLNKRKWYVNTSGGSTGVPVKFVQDKEYWDKAISTKLFYSLMAGKDLGEKEIKLWGSERDIFEGSIGHKAKLQNWLYNRLLLNSFLMSEEDMKRYVKIWNEFKPVIVWTYVDSIYEFTKFIDKNNLEICSPKSIIVTAGTLHKDVRDFVEIVFKSKIMNQYGSREAGDIAAECINREGLHIFEYCQYVEVLNDELEPVKEGELGQIYVTNLNNYSMPLIRYKIGDIASISNKMCSCGRGFSMLAEVTGRVTDHFLKRDGTIIHGEYFTHLFYFKNWVKKFQVVQEDYNFVNVYVVLNETKDEKDIEDIKEKIKIVMGNDCRIKFEFVDEIDHSKSGKFLFTKSLVNKR